MIRILIISAIRLYRDGLAQVLGRNDRVEVVGAFEDVEGVFAGPTDRRAPPDVILLDTSNREALNDMRALSGEFPGVKVVALGIARDDDEVIACAEAGVDGYVFRDASIDELFATVDSAARGELRCSPGIAGTLLRRVANLARAGHPPHAAVLTRREQEILDLIERGCSNKQIAAALYIEVATVKNHIHNILEKLNVRTRAEAAARMRRDRGSRTSGPMAAVDTDARA